MKVLAVGFAALCCVGLAACGSSRSTTSPASTPAPPSMSVASPVATETTSSPVVETTSAAPSLFPAGYPKTVPVSSLPSQVKNWLSDYTQAVAVAPGVWAPLPPGASEMDAATAGVLDGFCASKHAYENQYLGGRSTGGACW